MKYNFLLKFVSFISSKIVDEIQAKMSNVQPELPLSYEQISLNFDFGIEDYLCSTTIR